MSHSSSFSFPKLFLPAALIALAVPSAAATAQVSGDQGPWLVTTNNSVMSVVPVIDHSDSALFRVQIDTAPFVQTSPGGWFAMAGFEPTDIDAIALRSTFWGPVHRTSFAFSLLSNEAGFLDGDVLGIAPGGGALVIATESALLGMLGIPSGNIDLDGVAFDDQGRLLFSLQGSHSGTVFGDVENGDVLRVEPDGSLTRLATEADVQTALFLATGLTDPIGDVHGVEWIGGALFVAVQAPSSVDGTVLRVGDAPALIATELSFGLMGAEIDGIAYLGDGVPAPTISMSHAVASPGSFIHSEGNGFQPGAAVLVLAAGSPGHTSAFGLGSFGDLLLDPLDPGLVAAAAVGFPILSANGLGQFSADFFLPITDLGGAWMGSSGWSMQAVDLSDLSITAPIRIKVQ